MRLLVKVQDKFYVSKYNNPNTHHLLRMLRNRDTVTPTLNAAFLPANPPEDADTWDELDSDFLED